MGVVVALILVAVLALAVGLAIGLGLGIYGSARAFVDQLATHEPVLDFDERELSWVKREQSS